MTSLHLAVVMGSAREGRFCDVVTRWVAGHLERQPGLSFEIVDPARLEGAPGHALAPAARAHLRARLAAADGFIVVTPEYNHAYPAVLKLVIDAADVEWRAKPVAFVSYGGVSGGLRAVEQLRLVFAELEAVTTRHGVSFANASGQFDGAGALREPALADRGMAKALATLRWWAEALRFARHDAPYGEPRPPTNAGVPAEHEGPVVLINTFTPKPGMLDAFLATQAADLRELAQHVPGRLAVRLHRAVDGQNAIGVTLFASANDHRRWLATARFAEHWQNIEPLLDRVDPRLYTIVFETGSW